MLEQFEIHPDWTALFAAEFEAAQRLLASLPEGFQPRRQDVFRVFRLAPSKVRVVIVGQDPYPTPGDATGLSFSVNRNARLPRSLQNIFIELASDLGTPLRTDGNLEDWMDQGVFLINRILTTPTGRPLGHRNLGWEPFTEGVISHLAGQGSVGLLMGNSAQQLSKYFSAVVETAHPSPLSANRGFFGTKPFSKINALLTEPINWV